MIVDRRASMLVVVVELIFEYADVSCASSVAAQDDQEAPVVAWKD
jgi:hypothetical protein